MKIVHQNRAYNIVSSVVCEGPGVFPEVSHQLRRRALTMQAVVIETVPSKHGGLVFVRTVDDWDNARKRKVGGEPVFAVEWLL